MFSEIINNLNPEQKEAVEYFGGPLLIIAGAGSGKTRVITHKIAYAIYSHKFYPSQIFASTFTNKAAGEMKSRVEKLLEGRYTAPYNIGTFHSLCAKILRSDGHIINIDKSYTILDEDDQISVIKRIIKNNYYSIEKENTPANILWHIGKAKINLKSPEKMKQDAKSAIEIEISKIYQEYQKVLDGNNSLDFDDLIYKTVLLFQNDNDTLLRYQNKFRYILVDEYQDTNYQQFELIRLLAGKEHNLCVVGDEDQSIYSWRGANIKNILDFQKHFTDVKIIKLEQNYRSTKKILNAANEVIKNNSERLGKTLWTQNDEGSKIYVIRLENDTDEARYVADRIKKYKDIHKIPYSEIAVFCRTNSLTRSPEEEFRLAKIPYKVIGAMRFYERAEIKDILSYLRLLIYPNNDIAFQRIINKPRRGLGEKAQSDLIDYSKKNNKSLFETLCYFYETNQFSRTQYKNTEHFLALFAKWQERKENLPPKELVKMIVEDIDYEAYLGQCFAETDVKSRMENIGELYSAVQEFFKDKPEATLEDFLERITLISSQDDLNNEDSVPIMTIHCAKGLEFQVVFIIGLEEPLFPNAYSIADTGKYEEERRLFYVAMTRAKKKLYLTYTITRIYRGDRKYFTKSCFINEIPRTMIEINDNKEFNPTQENQKETDTEKPKENFLVPELLNSNAIKNMLPIGERINHSKYGSGTIVGYKKIVTKNAPLIYFDKGFERIIQDIENLEIHKN